VRSCFALTAVLAVVTAGLGAAGAHAAYPGRNGLIAFGHIFYPAGSDELAGAHILRITTFGGGRSRELRTCRRRAKCEHGSPAWSPNGRRLAFDTALGEGGLGNRIVISGANGRNRRRLGVPDGLSASSPTWSPNGRRLAFTLTRQVRDAPDSPTLTQRSTLATINLDGSGFRELTTAGADLYPAWSSRGVIAFQRGYTDYSDIYVIRPDGSGLRRVTFRGGASPDWSPDGRRLAFARGPTDDQASLFALDMPTKRLRRLTRRRATNAAWSPDGRWIAFERGSAIFAMSSRGGPAVRIAKPRDPEAFYYGPDWQPLPSANR
jgi:Tol biopolymer transport system component